LWFDVKPAPRPSCGTVTTAILSLGLSLSRNLPAARSAPRLAERNTVAIHREHDQPSGTLEALELKLSAV
jgi:cob(I)alamin adenosyltransferase